ncbi:hypothetical protein PV328_004161 [Microctonus aethiopoides]|uniref:Uncharacterized protein n=1 Tax=Microctonus aethiopoides TaxID=144406 RepID=A0AA39F9Z7_9HYME|nr:hypothetical protein PV328_004161 [Microctonus aethiopoides]
MKKISKEDVPISEHTANDIYIGHEIKMKKMSYKETERRDEPVRNVSIILKLMYADKELPVVNFPPKNKELLWCAPPSSTPCCQKLSPFLPGPSLDLEEKGTEPGAEKPRVRYSSAARRRYKEQKRLGAEQTQVASAPMLGGEGRGS